MVHLERIGLLSTNVDTAMPKTNGRIGSDRHWCKVQGTSLLPYVFARQTEGTATAAWLQTWNLLGQHANPLHATKFPTKEAYLYVYAVNMAYIQPPEQNETPNFSTDLSIPPYTSWHWHWRGMGHWSWCNAQPPHGPQCGGTYMLFGHLRTKSVWFMVIHDLMPTNDRLARIQRSDTNHCTHTVIDQIRWYIRCL